LVEVLNHAARGSVIRPRPAAPHAWGRAGRVVLVLVVADVARDFRMIATGSITGGRWGSSDHRWSHHELGQYPGNSCPLLCARLGLCYALRVSSTLSGEERCNRLRRPVPPVAGRRFFVGGFYRLLRVVRLRNCLQKRAPVVLRGGRGGSQVTPRQGAVGVAGTTRWRQGPFLAGRSPILLELSTGFCSP